MCNKDRLRNHFQHRVGMALFEQAGKYTPAVGAHYYHDVFPANAVIQ
jgi:hypothetical protein